MECKDFLAKAASKLLDKPPINYRLVRNMPMALEKEMCVSKMKRVLEILVEGHRLKTNECDEEIYQSGQFLDECAGVILPLKILTQVNPFQELTCCCMNTCMCGL